MVQINVNSYITNSIVDGPGTRFVLFTQGCSHHCKGCHNPNTHSFSQNQLLSIEEIMTIIKRESISKKVTLSGGDPLFQADGIYELCKRLKEDGYNIYLYTGFVYEDIQKSPKLNKVLEVIDVLIDGKYVEELKDYSSAIVGSTNQRIIQLSEVEK